MGQKANPVSMRLGLTRGWDSNWFESGSFGDKILEDHKIRSYIHGRMPKGGISRIVVERTLTRVTLMIHTTRPGVVIGKGGTEVERLRVELKKYTGQDIQINIMELRRPELDAKLVADSVAQQLESRISFRRAIKQAIASSIRVGAQGIRIMCSGRLGGAEMARKEQYKEGRIPLHTLRADIDYAVTEAYTVYGKIGVKVWIFRGEFYNKDDYPIRRGLDRLTHLDEKASRRRGMGPSNRR